MNTRAVLEQLVAHFEREARLHLAVAVGASGRFVQHTRRTAIAKMDAAHYAANTIRQTLKKICPPSSPSALSAPPSREASSSAFASMRY